MDDSFARDRGLTILKWLVVTLTATMIAGIIVLMWLFWTRLPKPLSDLPAEIALPDGVRAEGVTLARGMVLVVTNTGEILVFDDTGSRLIRRISIE